MTESAAELNLPSLKKKIEINMAKTTDVSLKADTNAMGEISEAEGHHPGLLTEWGKVTVTWWSHSIKGLHRNDFIMAARTDEVAKDAEGRK